MGKLTILWLAISTVVVSIAFFQGAGVLRGGDVATHLYWGAAAFFVTLGANLFAMFHAGQTDRLLRALRADNDRLRQRLGEPPADD